MGYANLDSLLKQIPEKVLIQLTDDDRLGVIDETKVDEAIAAADAEIDAYCATRYAVPFASAPAVIRKICADMAVYHLYARKAEKLPETRSERYKASVALLKDIARGLVSLGVDPAPAASTQADQAAYNAGDRVFTKDTLENF